MNNFRARFQQCWYEYTVKSELTYIPTGHVKWNVLWDVFQDKKAAQEKERENRIAASEVENLSGSRHQEGLRLRQKLAEKQLQIKEISSDGHCMYRAVEDQLTERGSSLRIQELRAQTAQYMRSHEADFLPFLTNPNTGDMYTAGEPQH